jgi:GNAT superfamily N-acetyltransferase
MSESITNDVRVEPATVDDLPLLVQLLVELFEEEGDFSPDPARHEVGLRLILENPKGGRILVIRNDHTLIGMVNLLFTISTAVGGMVLLMEDVIIHPAHRGQGYGSRLISDVEKFARKKGFKRITLLTDKISAESQRFFQRHGYAFSNMIPMRLLLE